MNYLFFGKAADLNIGNGKSVSAIKKVYEEYLLHQKTVFSNIKLIGIPYTELTPYNVLEVIETNDAVVYIYWGNWNISLFDKTNFSC